MEGGEGVGGGGEEGVFMGLYIRCLPKMKSHPSVVQ